MDIIGVTESAVRRIREEIITGRLAPTTRLHETDISERFGISRPPLREAFRLLGNEKLVEFVPRRGTFVAGMSLEDGDQIYRVRQMLECTAIDILSQQDAPSFEPLRGALTEAQELSGKLSVIDNFYVMSRFHVRLIETAGNCWLMSCHQNLQSCLARYQVMYLNMPGSTPRSLDEHVTILSCLENGRHAEAKQHLTAHLERTRQCLRDAMPFGSAEAGRRENKRREGSQG